MRHVCTLRTRQTWSLTTSSGRCCPVPVKDDKVKAVYNENPLHDRLHETSAKHTSVWIPIVIFEMCTISKVIGINEEKEKCLPNREYLSGHRWERINMVVKCIVHMHITAELKAYWLLVFLIYVHINSIFCLKLQILHKGVFDCHVWLYMWIIMSL